MIDKSANSEKILGKFVGKLLENTSLKITWKHISENYLKTCFEKIPSILNLLSAEGWNER